MLIFEVFFWFVLYSFLGWVWEVTLHFVQERNFANRGFLSGPYCPIYGCGALFFVALWELTGSPLVMALCGGAIACVFEYLVSFLMEKIFKARWWDYSHYPLNLNGRICFYGWLAFTLFATLTPPVHGLMVAFTEMWPAWLLIGFDLVVALLMLSDAVTSSVIIRHFDGDLAQYERALARDAELHPERLRYTYRRILASFPTMKTAHDSVLTFLRRSSLENAERAKTARRLNRLDKKTERAENRVKKAKTKAEKIAMKAERKAEKIVEETETKVVKLQQQLANRFENWQKPAFSAQDTENLPDFGQEVSKNRQFLRKNSRKLAKKASNLAKNAAKAPILTRKTPNFNQKSSKIVQNQPKIARNYQKMTKNAQNQAKSAESHQKPVGFIQNSGKIKQNSAKTAKNDEKSQKNSELAEKQLKSQNLVGDKNA